MKNNNYFIDKFDTEFFQDPVCKLLLPDENSVSLFDGEGYQNFLKENKVKFIVCVSGFYQKNIRFLKQQGYDFISTKVLYAIKSPKIAHKDLPAGFKIVMLRQYSPDYNSEGVKDLISLLSKTSHYSEDRSFPLDVSRKIYTKWFFNTFNGYAQEVFVLLKGQELAGIISLKKHASGFFIDLLGVRATYRGLGLGASLIEEATKYALRFNEKLFVYTQGENIPANRIYQRSGFVLENMSIVYHKIF